MSAAAATAAVSERENVTDRLLIAPTDNISKRGWGFAYRIDDVYELS